MIEAAADIRHDLRFYAEQIYHRCDSLAEFTQTPEIMDRRYLTHEHAQANAQVASWMQEAGMSTWQDQAGNQWGRYQGSDPDAPTLIFGSHLDTVPNGGKYDGILGVLLPITMIQLLQDSDQGLPFSVEIVGFGDEEGTRFGSTLLGSRAVAGTWNETWANLKDENGISMAQAFSAFDLDIDEVFQAARDPESILAFLEIHIEQGPVLEAEDLPVGCVTAIAGARRFNVHVQGHAGHAGTVPMGMRQDSLTAASQMNMMIELEALRKQVVATVGNLRCFPGAVNVIPGAVEFTLDVRAETDEKRDRAIELIQKRLRHIADSREVSVSWQENHKAAAVQCNAKLCQQVVQAIKQSGYDAHSLPSGAGHDAMAMADICPVSMIFMRNEKGISHHPDESVTVEDIEATLKVVRQLLFNIKRHNLYENTTYLQR